MCVCMRGITPQPCCGQGSGGCVSRVTARSATHTRKETASLGNVSPDPRHTFSPTFPSQESAKARQAEGV